MLDYQQTMDRAVLDLAKFLYWGDRFWREYMTPWDDAAELVRQGYIATARSRFSKG